MEYQPAVTEPAAAVDQRVEAAVGEPLYLPPREIEPPPDPTDQGWDIGVQLGAAYNDNIFLSRTSPESDVIVRVTPKIGWVNGREGGEGGYLSIIYRPSGVIYLDHGSENRIDHELVVAASYEGRRTGVAYKGGFRRLGDPQSELGGLNSDRTEYANEIRLIWRPKEKIGVQVAAGQTTQDYDQAVLTDADSSYFEAGLEYAYSPKTRFLVAYRNGRTEIDRAPKQTFQQATVQMIWQPREKWKVNLRAGIESRDYVQGGDTYGVFDGRVEWAARAGTSLFVAGYRREDVSAVFAGQNMEVLGVSAGLRQKLGEHWVATLEGGYESSDYKRVAGTGAANRSDEVIFVRPALEYSVTDDFRVGAFYRYERNSSNNVAFGYDNHQLGVDLEYEF
ncbi:outer membrane beta-barrel protein [Haloferula sargassicola]|uniref:outer membrane beta-barrel protein n=1 Tax=Haloferula sargassicola TaxID=490096 RepID=UPI003365A7DD